MKGGRGGVWKSKFRNPCFFTPSTKFEGRLAPTRGAPRRSSIRRKTNLLLNPQPERRANPQEKNTSWIPDSGGVTEEPKRRAEHTKKYHHWLSFGELSPYQREKKKWSEGKATNGGEGKQRKKKGKNGARKRETTPFDPQRMNYRIIGGRGGHANGKREFSPLFLDLSYEEV